MAAEAKSEPDLPVHTLTIISPLGSREALLHQLHDFADANNFAIRVGYPRPPSKDFVTVQLWRDDIQIVAINPEDPNQIKVGFYRGKGDVGDDAVKTSEALSEKLTVMVSTVPGTTVANNKSSRRAD